MIELDGLEYPMMSAQENTTSMVQAINKYCTDNNVRNSRGEVIYIDSTPTNPLYMILYGVGVLASILQKLMYSAACSMNLARASEKQLLNIGDMTGIRRRQASHTTIPCLVYATTDSGCSVTVNAEVTIAVGSSTVTFKPCYDIEVERNSVGYVLLQAPSDDYGSYNIDAGAATTFDEPIIGLDHITLLASIPGRQIESIRHYRKRLLARTEAGDLTDRCSEAIEELEGVSRAHIFFNSYANSSITIGDSITVPPRKALVMVQGYNSRIAEMYWRYMLVETVGEGFAGQVIDQSYFTHAGQEMVCHILTPIQIPLYIHLYTREETTEAQRTVVQEGIMELAATLGIGEELTAADIMAKYEQIDTDVVVQGIELSKDGLNFYYVVSPSDVGLFIFNKDNIVFYKTPEEDI